MPFPLWGDCDNSGPLKPHATGGEEDEGHPEHDYNDVQSRAYGMDLFESLPELLLRRRLLGGPHLRLYGPGLRANGEARVKGDCRHDREYQNPYGRKILLHERYHDEGSKREHARDIPNGPVLREYVPHHVPGGLPRKDLEYARRGEEAEEDERAHPQDYAQEVYEPYDVMEGHGLSKGFE